MNITRRDWTWLRNDYGPALLVLGCPGCVAFGEPKDLLPQQLEVLSLQPLAGGSLWEPLPPELSGLAKGQAPLPQTATSHHWSMLGIKTWPVSPSLGQH